MIVTVLASSIWNISIQNYDKVLNEIDVTGYWNIWNKMFMVILNLCSHKTLTHTVAGKEPTKLRELNFTITNYTFFTLSLRQEKID